jgi:hypothetical protein
MTRLTRHVPGMIFGAALTLFCAWLVPSEAQAPAKAAKWEYKIAPWGLGVLGAKLRTMTWRRSTPNSKHNSTNSAMKAGSAFGQLTAIHSSVPANQARTEVRHHV